MLKKMFFTALMLALPAVMFSCDDSSEGGGDHNDSMPVCGNGVMESGEECDGQDLGTLTCESLGYAGGTLACTDSCTLDMSGCQGYCGDGRIQGSEECDGDDMGGMTCMDLGFERGRLTCTSDCGFDVSRCVMGCGNGVLEPGEECDGTDLGGASCENLGYGSGSLSCSPYCTLDVSRCEAAPETCGNGVLDASEMCDGTPEAVGDLTGECHECTWAEYYWEDSTSGLSPATRIIFSSMTEDGSLMFLTSNVYGVHASAFSENLDIVADSTMSIEGGVRWAGIRGDHFLVLQEKVSGTSTYGNWVTLTLYSMDISTGTVDGSWIIADATDYVCGGHNRSHAWAYRDGDTLYVTYQTDRDYGCQWAVPFDVTVFDLASMSEVLQFRSSYDAYYEMKIAGIHDGNLILYSDGPLDNSAVLKCPVDESSGCTVYDPRSWTSTHLHVKKRVAKYFNDYGYLLIAVTPDDASSPFIDVYDVNMAYYGTVEPFNNLPGTGTAVIDDILLKDGVLYVSATVDGDLGGSSFGGTDAMIFRFAWPTLERQIALRFGTAGDDGSTKVFPTAHGTAVLGHGTGFFTGSHYLYVEHPFLWMSTK